MIRKMCGVRYLWKLALLGALAGSASASLPVGSVVFYSDGRVEKLLSQEDGGLVWEDDRKRLFRRSLNPIVPVLERRDFLSGKGYSQVVSSGEPDSIRTRAHGDPLEFTIRRVRHTGESSRRIWECRYLGANKKKVLGVMRSLDSYTCERFTLHRKTWQREFRESRQFSYSGDLGIVVKMKRKTRSSSKSWKLASIALPGEASYKQLRKKVGKIRTRK